MERQLKYKAIHEGEEKSEESEVRHNIMKSTEQRGKAFNVLAQPQVGQSRDNQDNQDEQVKVMKDFQTLSAEVEEKISLDVIGLCRSVKRA